MTSILPPLELPPTAKCSADHLAKERTRELLFWDSEKPFVLLLLFRRGEENCPAVGLYPHCLGCGSLTR